MRALGWWGRKVVAGPDGDEEVQLGSPRRLKTIYDTNMRTANNAARFRRQHANAESRPYWMYDAVNDSRTRPSHAAMDGRVYAHDDPIWATHYPPNGWNCRCRVRALTASQVRARGLAVYDTRKGAGADGLLTPERDPPAVGVDRRTGEEIRRPGTSLVFERGGRAVTVTPDPGWSYNPGRTGAPFGPLTGDPTRLRPLVGGQTTASDLGLPPLGPALRRTRGPRASGEAEAVALIHAAIRAAGGRILKLDDGRRQVELQTVPTPVGAVTLTGDFVKHVAAKRGEARERFADYIVPTLEDPVEVWLQATIRDGRVLYEPVYIGDHGTYSVVQEHRMGTLGWAFYPERGMERHRRGYLLYRR